MNLLSLALLLCCAAFAEVTVLKNFTLIDGTGRAPVAGSAMIIQDGRISWVGSATALKVPNGAEVNDLSGKFVMPGMINLHGHLGLVVGLTQDPKFFTRENVEKSLQTYASYGVTSVLSMGTDQPLIYKMREEQRGARPSTTRIFTAGRGFTGIAGYPTSAPGLKGVPYEVATTGQAQAFMKELAAHKPDAVKMWVDDHLGKQNKIQLELARAVVSAARTHNLRSAAHVFYLEDAKQLATAGLNAFAHSVRDKPVDDELIRIMKQKGTWLIAPTLTREASTFVYAKPAPFLSDAFFTRSVSPEVVSTLKTEGYQKKVAADPDFRHYPAFLETAKQNLKRLADAGVKFGFGTDSGPPARFPGFFEHWEMDLMVDAGLTPMQVIMAASKQSSEFLGMSKDLGTLEPGKWADLLVLQQDPLKDIKNTRSLQAVYIAGKPVSAR
ncbi:MAG TPA: amidohydrolase family protein [Bryobacteraceae bacterium]|nr:amidohydrolase family protein [Bryobacteraceae bacterium]